jgi:hypothetical protein
MRRRDLLHPPQAYGTLNAPALRLSLDDDAIKPLGRRRISRPEKSFNTWVEPADAIRPMYPPRPIGAKIIRVSPAHGTDSLPQADHTERVSGLVDGRS